ncbi:odorant receptor 22c-like [Leptopilina heterotoma]|uniref:odorant receptor 22c-like n=1 Tax=Leptopilina heterotoma TaxID=63436 RepID=UPI001CA81687|nr:odorant receptor 22c-like [Leptopilina heterotoma]
MNFKSTNKFIVLINLLSGNLLPSSYENSEFQWGWKIYAIILWILETIYFLFSFLGLFLVPKVEALQYGTINMVVLIEVLMLSIYVNCRRNDLKQLIKMINNILNNSDENKILNCIRLTTNPIDKPLRIYITAVVGTVFFWTVSPIIKIMEQNEFSILDFRVPTYFIEESFTMILFICGTLFQAISASILIGKKSSIDFYVIHMITLVTSEYRYVSDELESLFETNSVIDLKISDKDEKLFDNVSRIKKFKRLIQHHNSVTEIGKLLKSLLSLNIALTYGNCIFRFCFLSFMIITLPISIFDKCLIVLYTSGSMIQVFMLCYCAQTLLEASTSVTKNAFYKEWYKCDLSCQKIYFNMMISNKLECKLTAFGTIDMSISTFMIILKQSYSACLFLLKLNY